MLGLDGHHPVFLREHACRALHVDTSHLRHDVTREIVIPTSVSDVLLCHHAIPLSSGNVVVVCCAKDGVALESHRHPIGPQVGVGITLPV